MDEIRAGRVLFAASAVVSAGSLLTLALTVGLPAEGDPRAWLYTVPFAISLVGALVVAAFGHRDRAATVAVGGVVGAFGVLVAAYALVAATMSS